MIYFGSEHGKLWEGYLETAKDKAYEFYSATTDCAAKHGVTVLPGIGITRTTGGKSPLQWPGVDGKVMDIAKEKGLGEAVK